MTGALDVGERSRLHAAGWLLVHVVAAAGTRDLFIPNSAGDRVNGTGKRLEGVVQGIAVPQLPAMLNPDADRRGASASNTGLGRTLSDSRSRSACPR